MKLKLALLFFIIPSIAFAQAFGNLYADKAYQIKTNTSKFGNNIAASSTTVQSALDYLNWLSICQSNGTNCLATASSQWITNGTVGIGTTSNVGVGTINPSNAKLAVLGNVGIGTTAGDSFLSTAPPNGGLIAYGNVGVGVASPTEKLHILNNASTASILIDDANPNSGCDAQSPFLTHFDGTNGATSATELNCNGSGAKTITFSGTSSLSTAQKEFGTASLNLDGSGALVSIPDSSDIELLGSDFTFDTWYRFASVGNAGIVAKNGTAANFGWQFYYQNSDTSLYLDWSTNGSGTQASPPHVSWTPSANTWYHIEIDRSGNNLYFFVNGVQQGATQTMSTSVFNGTSIMCLGVDDCVAKNYKLNGFIDEPRLSVGIARHTSNFTPPSLAYAVGGNIPGIKFGDSGTTRFSIIQDGANSNVLKTQYQGTTLTTLLTGGNLGIGTTSPPNLLYVAGTAEMQGFKMAATPTSGYALITNSVGVGTWAPITVAGGSGTVNSGTINQSAYYSATGTAVSGSTDMYDDGTNIGIGTVSAQNQLVVMGNVGIGTVSSSAFARTVPDARGVEIEGNVGIGTAKNSTAGLSVMNGNVGIGTWKPAAMLQINPDATGFRVDSTGAITEIAGNSSVNLNASTWSGINSGGSFILQNNSSTSGSNTLIRGGGSASSSIEFRSTSGTGTSDFVKFTTGSNGATEAMRVISSGNVGIGTTVPGGALSVMNGNVGIGTWNPTGTLQIIGTGNVGISSTNPGALVDIGGNLRLATGGFFVSQQTTAPTIANNDCGTTAQGTVAANSADLLGSVNVGTLAVTSCAMTFNKTHATAPICFCQDDSNVLAVRCSTTTTKMTITSATSMSSDVVAYWCPTNIP